MHSVRLPRSVRTTPSSTRGVPGTSGSVSPPTCTDASSRRSGKFRGASLPKNGTNVVPVLSKPAFQLVPLAHSGPPGSGWSNSTRGWRWSARRSRAANARAVRSASSSGVSAIAATGGCSAAGRLEGSCAGRAASRAGRVQSSAVRMGNRGKWAAADQVVAAGRVDSGGRAGTTHALFRTRPAVAPPTRGTGTSRRRHRRNRRDEARALSPRARYAPPRR